MKYLLYHGCSFTEDYYKSFDKNFTSSIRSWPYWASEKLGEDFVCLAKSGRPNSIILTEAIDHILTNNNKISCAIISLSTWDRFHIVDNRFCFIPTHHRVVRTYKELYEQKINETFVKHIEDSKGYYQYYFDEMDDNDSWRTTLRNILTDYFVVDYKAIINLYTDTLRLIINLVNLCNTLNIPLILSQGPTPMPCYYGYHTKTCKLDDLKMFFPFHAKETFYDGLVLRSKLFKPLSRIVLNDKKNIFLGWPFLRGMGGKEMRNYLMEFVEEGLISKADIDVSEMDKHPSEAAHKLYGENIIAPEILKLVDK